MNSWNIQHLAGCHCQ